MANHQQQPSSPVLHKLRRESPASASKYENANVHPGILKALLSVEENVYQTTLNLSLPSSLDYDETSATEEEESADSNKFFHSSVNKESTLNVPTALAIVDCLERNRRIQRLEIDVCQWFSTKNDQTEQEGEEANTALRILCDFFITLSLNRQHKLRCITLVGSRKPRSNHIRGGEEAHNHYSSARCTLHRCNRKGITTLVQALAQSPIQRIRLAQVDFAKEPTLTGLCQALMMMPNEKTTKAAGRIVASLQFHSCTFAGSQLWQPLWNENDTFTLSAQHQLQDLQWFDCRDWTDSSAASVLRAVANRFPALKRLSLTWMPLLHHQTYEALVHNVLPELTQLQSLQVEHNVRLFAPAVSPKSPSQEEADDCAEDQAAAVPCPTQQFADTICRNNDSLLHIQVNHNQTESTTPRSDQQNNGQSQTQQGDPSKEENDASGTNDDETEAKNLLRDDTTPAFQSILKQCRERNRWNGRVRKLLLGKQSYANTNSTTATAGATTKPMEDLALWGKALGTLTEASQRQQEGLQETSSSTRTKMMDTTVSATFLALSSLSPLLVASVQSSRQN